MDAVQFEKNALNIITDIINKAINSDKITQLLMDTFSNTNMIKDTYIDRLKSPVSGSCGNVYPMTGPFIGKIIKEIVHDQHVVERTFKSELKQSHENKQIVTTSANRMNNLKTIHINNDYLEAIIGTVLAKMEDHSPCFMRIFGGIILTGKVKTHIQIMSEKLDVFDNSKLGDVGNFCLYMAMIVHALWCSQKMCRFIHSDLHSGNIMSKKLVNPNFEYDNNIYTFKTDTVPVIIDYGYSSIRIHNVNLVPMVGKGLNLEAGRFNPFADYLKYIVTMMRDNPNNSIIKEYWKLIFPKTNFEMDNIAHEDGPNIQKLTFLEEMYGFINKPKFPSMEKLFKTHLNMLRVHFPSLISTKSKMSTIDPYFLKPKNIVDTDYSPMVNIRGKKFSSHGLNVSTLELGDTKGTFVRWSRPFEYTIGCCKIRPMENIQQYEAVLSITGPHTLADTVSGNVNMVFGELPGLGTGSLVKPVDPALDKYLGVITPEGNYDDDIIRNLERGPSGKLELTGFVAGPFLIKHKTAIFTDDYIRKSLDGNKKRIFDCGKAPLTQYPCYDRTTAFLTTSMLERRRSILIKFDNGDYALLLTEKIDLLSITEFMIQNSTIETAIVLNHDYQFVLKINNVMYVDNTDLWDAYGELEDDASLVVRFPMPV